MNSFNIIGDIAGNYHALMLLLAKMPEGTPVSVGDMIDRGPNSVEVMRFFASEGLAVKGNHEHMMCSHFYERGFYSDDCWGRNGGLITLNDLNQISKEEREALVKWADNLPYILELELPFTKVLVTHAPVNPVFGLERAITLCDTMSGYSVIWNRGSPRRIMKYELQLFGHNSYRQPKVFKDALGEFAIGLDTSEAGVLTGLHLPSGVIYTQEI